MAESIRLHAERFETLIQRRGRDVAWEEALLCSCWNMDSGQPKYDCMVCGGKGYTYQPPITGRVLVTSVTQAREFEEMAGMFQLGDAIMTVPKRMWQRLPNGQFNMREYEDVPLYNIGMYDLITLLDEEYKSSEILIKGTAIYGRPADTLMNDRITAIQLVRKSHPGTGNVVEYEEGVDFVLNDKTIEWLPDGNAPADGEQYSVVYRHRPVFTVLTTLPRPRHQDGQDLPRYVVLRYRSTGFEPK